MGAPPHGVPASRLIQFRQYNSWKDQTMPAYKITALASLAALAALVSCVTASAGGGSPETPGFYEGFREIRVAPGLSKSTDFIDALLPFLRGHPESLEGNPKLELKVWPQGSGFRVDLLKTGYADDSVYGNRYRGEVILTSSGEWELLTPTVRDLCMRGESPDGGCL